jgi:hypothetical protein
MAMTLLPTEAKCIAPASPRQSWALSLQSEQFNSVTPALQRDLVFCK